ncbi:MAG TPA: NEW3 domain-containing protein [Methanocella sp.]|jgi:uncharacterized membrane protein
MRRAYAIPLLATLWLALALLVCITPASADYGFQGVYADWAYNGTTISAGGALVTPVISNNSDAVRMTVRLTGYDDMTGTVNAGNVMDFHDLVRITVIGIDRDSDKVYLQIAKRGSSSTTPSGTALSCSVPGQKALGGDKVIFPITIQNLDAEGHMYTLSASSGTGWTLSFASGGKNVYKVSVPGQQSLTVDLIVQTSAATGLGEKRVTANVDSSAIDLYVYVTSVNHTADLTAKAGSVVAGVGDRVLYELHVRNTEAGENDYRLSVADLPTGWYYRFKEDAASTAEISEIIVPPGADKSIALEIIPPYSVQPGDYAFTATVTTPGDDVLTKNLSLKLKSGADMTVTTPVLSYDAKPGQPFEISLYVGNNGRGAALTNVQVETTAPSGWIVTVSPNQTSGIAAGTSSKITLKVQPPGNIVASEYPLSAKVKCDQGAKTIDYRIKVTTDSYIPYIGGGIILVVVVGLFLVVRKFGRR